MATYRTHHFHRKQVLCDGNVYEDCTFEDSRLRVEGRAVVRFLGTSRIRGRTSIAFSERFKLVATGKAADASDEERRIVRETLDALTGIGLDPRVGTVTPDDDPAPSN